MAVFLQPQFLVDFFFQNAYVLPCWRVAIPPRSQQLSTVSPSKSGRISVYPKLLQRASINSSMQVFKRNYKSQAIYAR